MGDLNKNNNDENRNKKHSENMEKFKSIWINTSRKLLDKDGFYFILFICICIVATTAVWVSVRNVTNDKEISDNIQNDAIEGAIEDIFNKDNTISIVEDSMKNFGDDSTEIIADDKSNDEATNQTSEEDSVVENNEELIDEPIEEYTEEEAERLAQEESVEVLFQRSQKDILNELALPVRGTVSLEYSMDKLIYSKTLEQWTTHDGLDIRSVEGSEVVAVLDGIVTDVVETKDEGIVITIDHGAGIKSQYSYLSTNKMIEIGQTVSKEETISGIGKPIGFELSQGAHLHFELIVNGENVDPRKYLPKMN